MARVALIGALLAPSEGTSDAACTPAAAVTNNELPKIPAPRTVATHHVMKPCAVSLKKTSCVWIPTHRVRKRPAMYPPAHADSHCVKMSQMTPLMVNGVADTPWLTHGEIDADPMPDPKAIRMSEVAAATNAPAMIAGHEAADRDLVRCCVPALSKGAASTGSIMSPPSGANTWRAIG